MGKDKGDSIIIIIVIIIIIIIKGDIQHLYLSYLRFLLRDHLS